MFFSPYLEKVSFNNEKQFHTHSLIIQEIARQQNTNQHQLILIKQGSLRIGWPGKKAHIHRIHYALRYYALYNDHPTDR